MELDPTDEQRLLLEASTQFIEDTFPLSRIREFAEGGPAAGPAERAAAAELGWFAMFVPEQHGGGSVSGDPVADAALLARLRGASLQPGPFLATNTVAAVLARAGTAAQRESVLPGLADGTATAALPVSGDAMWGDAGPRAARSGDGLVLDGDGVLVDDPEAAYLLVSARLDAQVVPVLIPLDRSSEIRRTRLECLDLTRRLDALSFHDLRVPSEAVLTDPGAVPYGAAVATVLSVADSVGAMDRLFAMTRQYALDRIAFGRPIGSFQAIKHLLADVSLVVESAKAVLAAAVRALSAGASYAAEVAAIAKVYVGERAARMAQDCQQVHGGIGFAWEHDLHFYLRRLTANAAFHGTTAQHREAVLAAHAAELEKLEAA